MKSPENGLENQTNEIERTTYNFEELAELEPAFIKLVEELKENIENGEYDALISDDAGGRIPTLVLRKIIQKIRPDIDLKTAFVSAGRNLPDNNREANKDEYDQMIRYIQHVVGQPKKALVITQFVDSGTTFLTLSKILNNAGVGSFDLATLDVDKFTLSDDFKYYLKLNSNHRFFIGSDSDEWHKIHEGHERFSGVRRAYPFRPFPEKLVDALKKQGPSWYNEELSPEKQIEIQEDIVKAREDVSVLADRVAEKVWNNPDSE